MAKLMNIDPAKFDPTEPGIYFLVVSGPTVADAAGALLEKLNDPRFQNGKFEAVVCQQEMRMNQVMQRGELLYTMVCIMRIPVES